MYLQNDRFDGIVEIFVKVSYVQCKSTVRTENQLHPQSISSASRYVLNVYNQPNESPDTHSFINTLRTSFLAMAIIIIWAVDLACH